MTDQEIKSKAQTGRLFWEKYRPATMDDIILPPRIRKIVEHGIHTNLLLVGPPGMGKTTLAKILVKDHPFIIRNAKLGVDMLRNDVKDFCQSIAQNPFGTTSSNKIKIVYLEEFDGASKALQEDLRFFIEEFESKVRFIATANNSNKIIEAMHSRFNVIDFTPKSQDEIKSIKIDFLKRLIKITENEKLNVTPDQIKDIVKSNFPDLRKCMSVLQLVHLTGALDIEQQNDGDTTIYDIVSKQTSPTETWNYLYANWLDRLDNAFQMFDKKYWKYIEETRPSEMNKMPNRMIKVSQYVDVHLNNARDPFVTLCAMIFELQQI